MNEFINELLSLSRTKLGGPDVGVVKVDSKYSDSYDTAMRRACELLVRRPGVAIVSVKEVCPDVGQRVENLFSVALATILSLLSTKDTRV